MRAKLFGAVAALTLLVAVNVAAYADTFTFTDNFSPQQSPLWSNSIGNWTSSGGTYFAQAPSNSPETYSGLPFDFTNSNFSLTVTINGLRDEGIWLNTDGSRNNGILFVAGGNGQQGDWAYWAVFQNGHFGNCCLSTNFNAFPARADLTYTITVLINGDIYAPTEIRMASSTATRSFSPLWSMIRTPMGRSVSMTFSRRRLSAISV